MVNLIIFFVACNIFTVLPELIPALFMKNRREWIKSDLVCNMITTPVKISLYLIIFFRFDPFIVLIPFLEIFCLFFEAEIYRKMMNAPRKKCIIFALVTNLIALTGFFAFFLLFNLFLDSASGPPSIPYDSWNYQ